MPDWSSIKENLAAAGVSLSGGSLPMPVSGGDISAAWRLPTGDGDLFIKTGPLSAGDMFAAEAEGLQELASAGAVRVPRVIGTGRSDADVFLACEWLDFEPAGPAVERLLGEQLAALHRVTADRYGWHRDNTIGLTPQLNTPGDDWLAFFREQRLGYQLQLAVNNGFGSELQALGDRLLKRLPIFFDAAPPAASLLHGDLWAGNWACCDAAPVIFDPAVYYGDRETDLAMTQLFGGFGTPFYEAYNASWPLAAGYGERCSLYQLYHVLNHVNLFGSAYVGRATSLMRELL